MDFFVYFCTLAADNGGIGMRLIVRIMALLVLACFVGCTPDEYAVPEGQEPAVTDSSGGGNDTPPPIDPDTTAIDPDTTATDTSVVVGVNLLLNGGLEQWIDRLVTNYDIPEYWYCHNNHNVTKNSEVVHFGRYSARMSSLETGSTARLDQCVAVTPGTRIRIRFRYRVEQWKSKGARTYCYFRTAAAESYNIPTDELRAFYSNEEYYIIRGGGRGLTYLPHDLDVWKLFDETITVPPTAHYFVFGINSYHGTTLYVDDCQVIGE